MEINSQTIKRLIIAAAFASGLVVSAGVAASAQTTAAPAATSPNATTVSMSSVADVKAKRQAELEQENADARRIAFQHLGTSL